MKNVSKYNNFGKLLSDPLGYLIQEKKCLDIEDTRKALFHGNVTLDFCVEECNNNLRLEELWLLFQKM